MTLIKNISVRLVYVCASILLVSAMGLAPLTTHAAEADARLLAKLTTILKDYMAEQNPSETLSFTRDLRAQKIEKFFRGWEKVGLYIPATEYADQFVRSGDKYGIDPLLVAAIAFNESGGFQKKFMCGNNGFGWNIPPGSGCRDQFTSIDNAIDVVAYNLGGHNPNTHFYKDKTVDQIINIYNPASIAPDYFGNVKGTMAKMANQEV
ncbi:MAG: hypothetical protein ACI83D_000026 [Planctomycetota bacterium]|jgi:hypothetical protein